MSKNSEHNETVEDEKLMRFLSDNDSSAPELSPLFAKNVIREIRLEDTTPQISALASLKAWFSKYSLPVLISTAALTVSTSLWISSTNPFDNQQGQSLSISNLSDSNRQTAEPLADEEYSQFSEDLLIMAAEDFDFLTDSEVLALLY